MTSLMEGLGVGEESLADRVAIRELVARAFAGAERHAPSVEGDGVPGEVTLVEWLRESSAYDPRFALVAIESAAGAAGNASPHASEEVVGFVMATWGDVDGVPLLGIGPLAVAPEWQRRGIGSALVRDLMARVRAAGENVVVLLGDPAFYGPLGFVPAMSVGILGDPQWGNYFQACVLDEDALLPRGSFTYAEPFARLG